MYQRFCTSLCLLLGVCTLPAFGQVQLEWKFTPKDTFYLETVSTIKQTMNALGKETRQDIDLTMVLSFTVKDKTADSTVIEQKIETFKVAGKTNPPDEKVLEQMLGATFTITFNQKMEIVKFEGYEDLIKKIGSDDPQSRKTIEEMMPLDTMKKSLQDALAFLPATPVKPGDKWETKQEQSLGPLGSLTRTMNFAYEGKVTANDKELHKITFTATAAYAPPKDQKKNEAFQVTKGNVTVKDLAGTIYFDAAAGRLSWSEMKMNLEGNLSLLIGTTPLEMSVRQEMTTTTRLLDKKP